MRNFIYTLLICFCAVSATATELTDSADLCYEKGDYSSAIELYNRAISDEGTSTDLYYNLGNAYYRAGNQPQAILAYERALRLDPANSEAKANLKFVNERIIDKKGETGSFLYNLYLDIVGLMSSNAWAVTAIILLLVTIAAAGVYALSSDIMLRKAGFFGGFVTAALCIGALVLAIAAREEALDDSYAVITSESATLSTAPHTPKSHAEEAMLLHAGTKVRILRTLGEPADSTSQVWHEVQVDNKHRAWINDKDIEKIR